VQNDQSTAEKRKVLKTWPITFIAGVFLLEGLSGGYSAFASVGVLGHPAPSGTIAGLAGLDVIVSVALIVAGAGLLARNRVCLTIAVILAGLNLSSAGSLAVGAFFGAPPVEDLAAILLIAGGWLQYAILRSQSTMALFSNST
jgi:hypothetical protein